MPWGVLVRESVTATTLFGHTVILGCDPGAPASARSEVRRFLQRAQTSSEELEDAELVAGALVADSVRKADGELSMTVVLDVGWVTITVDDDAQLLPIPPPGRTPFDLDPVERIAHSWGFLRTPRGRQLWARIPVGAASRTDDDHGHGPGAPARLRAG